jgi:hypothetical protein
LLSDRAANRPPVRLDSPTLVAERSEGPRCGRLRISDAGDCGAARVLPSGSPACQGAFDEFQGREAPHAKPCNGPRQGRYARTHPSRADWGNGAFTKAILEGLFEGRADLLRKGTITLSQLDAYVADRVKQLTGGVQHPIMIRPPTVPDFPIALVAAKK